ncbi:MAG TPA: hypothetical protein VIH90_03395, partial [Candidatus Saccharimonadales bacterium]
GGGGGGGGGQAGYPAANGGNGGFAGGGGGGGGYAYDFGNIPNTLTQGVPGTGANGLVFLQYINAPMVRRPIITWLD